MMRAAQRLPDAAVQIGAVHYFAPGQCIYAEGSPATHFMLVISGLVRSCSSFADGRRFIGAFHTAGDVFGLERGATYQASAEAVSGTTLISYPAGSAPDGSSRQLLGSMMLCIDQARAHARRLGRFSAIERLASFLLECAERSQDRRLVTLEMTRQDIADYLGLTVETVSRVLRQLKREGMIEMPSPRQLEILDIATLRKIIH